MISKTLSNIDAPPGLGKPDCSHCSGLGYVIADVSPEQPGFGRAVPCVCRAAERVSTRYDALLRLSQIGTLLHCTFDSFRPAGHGLIPAKQRNLKMAYDQVFEYAQNPTGWLLLKGGYGCGKTHLAAAIANYRLDQGHPVLFINTPDLLDHLRATFSPNSTIRLDERFEQIREAPLLILDDLGTQSNSEWAQEKLYQLFNHRYNTRLPTVITTNLELELIEIRIHSRMVDPDLVKIVHITAPDFRGAGIGQEHSDLSSLSLHNDKTFDNFDLRGKELPRGQAENLHRAFEIAREYAKAPADWLVLNSIAYGNGKTHLAAAIANQVLNTGEPVLFIVVPDLLDHLRATFGPNSSVRLDRRFEEVKSAPLLILDDLGTESATPWVREKLYQLFNHRYNARLPTIITASLPINDIDPKLTARMLDESRCTFFVIEVPSYHGMVKMQRKPYSRNKTSYR